MSRTLLVESDIKNPGHLRPGSLVQAEIVVTSKLRGREGVLVIFVPVSFMSSISGRFLFQFGLTSSVAILVSLLVSFTLTPMMSARLPRGIFHCRGSSARH